MGALFRLFASFVAGLHWGFIWVGSGHFTKASMVFLGTERLNFPFSKKQAVKSWDQTIAH